MVDYLLHNLSLKFLQKSSQNQLIFAYKVSKEVTLAKIATLSTHLAAINSAFGAQPLTSL